MLHGSIRVVNQVRPDRVVMFCRLGRDGTRTRMTAPVSRLGTATGGSPTSKDHIKDHIKKWHPDRFETKYLIKVTADDREKVKQSARDVARYLSELFRNENENGNSSNLFGTDDGGPRVHVPPPLNEIHHFNAQKWSIEEQVRRKEDEVRAKEAEVRAKEEVLRKEELVQAEADAARLGREEARHRDEQARLRAARVPAHTARDAYALAIQQ